MSTQVEQNFEKSISTYDIDSIDYPREAFTHKKREQFAKTFIEKHIKEGVLSALQPLCSTALTLSGRSVTQQKEKEALKKDLSKYLMNTIFGQSLVSSDLKSLTNRIVVDITNQMVESNLINGSSLKAAIKLAEKNTKVGDVIKSFFIRMFSNKPLQKPQPFKPSGNMHVGQGNCMSILKSFFYGSEGSYKILGSEVKFTNVTPSGEVIPRFKGGFISKCARRCFNNQLFRWISFGYVHVFVHEMSHALAHKLITGQNAKISIISTECAGITYLSTAALSASPNQITFMTAAGSMGDIAFSACQIVAARVLKNYISWPIALTIQGGAIMWISGELLYSYVSARGKTNGDFGVIAKLGNQCLTVASAVLIAECAVAARLCAVL